MHSVRPWHVRGVSREPRVLGVRRGHDHGAGGRDGVRELRRGRLLRAIRRSGSVGHSVGRLPCGALVQSDERHRSQLVLAVLAVTLLPRGLDAPPRVPQGVSGQRQRPRHFRVLGAVPGGFLVRRGGGRSVRLRGGDLQPARGPLGRERVPRGDPRSLRGPRCCLARRVSGGPLRFNRRPQRAQLHGSLPALALLPAGERAAAPVPVGPLRLARGPPLSRRVRELHPRLCAALPTRTRLHARQRSTHAQQAQPHASPRVANRGSTLPCMADFCISGGRVRCRRNSYNERAGGADQTACTPCPSSSASGEAASALDDCRCPAQSYHAPILNSSRVGPNASSSAFECRPSPAGTDGSSNGTQLETLPLLSGYWRISRASSDVRRCPDAERGNASACRGGSGEPCAEGLQGVFCSGAACAVRNRALPFPRLPPSRFSPASPPPCGARDATWLPGAPQSAPRATRTFQALRRAATRARA